MFQRLPQKGLNDGGAALDFLHQASGELLRFWTRGLSHDGINHAEADGEERGIEVGVRPLGCLGGQFLHHNIQHRTDLPVSIEVSGTGIDFCGRMPFELPYLHEQVGRSHCVRSGTT